MIIRKGTIQDYDILFKFLNETEELQAGAQGDTYPPEWVKAILEDHDRDFALIAEEDGHITGFLLAEIWQRKGYSFLSDLFVLPEHRKRGIATQLLKKYEEEMNKIGLSRFMGWVLTDNKNMHNFMVKNGFKQESHFFLYEK